MDKKKVYKWIRIGGLLSFIPFVLAAGPIGGYLAGDFLEKKFALPHYVSAILIIAGFLGSAFETVKIIKAALTAEDSE
jgi:hypothetical protein